jgi:hypothetical protein
MRARRRRLAVIDLRAFMRRLPARDFTREVKIDAARWKSPLNRGGWGDRDRSITFRLQEEAAGVEVRAPAVDPGKAATFVRTHPEGDR